MSYANPQQVLLEWLRSINESDEASSLAPVIFGMDTLNALAVIIAANQTSGDSVSQVNAQFNTNDIEEASATVTYIGMEDKAGAWYLLKIDESSDFSFGHASVATDAGQATYTAAWTNRATLTYGDYNLAF